MSAELPPGLDRLPSGKVRARYRDADGRQHSKTFPERGGVRAAQAWLREQRAAVDAGVHVAPSTKTTVAEYARVYAASRPHRKTSARRVDSTITNHVEGTALGRMRLTEVTPSAVQTWVTDRSKVLAPSTLRITVNLMRSVFEQAVADRIIGRTPVVRIAMPRTETPRIVPLSIEQVEQITAKMPEQCRAMVTAQAGLGLRVGELVGLRLEDVDFLRRTVRVTGQITHGSRERSAPKTPLSVRTIPMPTIVAETLAEHLRQWPADLLDGWLFRRGPMTAYRQDSYGRVFRRAAEAAGMPAGTTSHDLRHHYASVLLAAGESVVAVAERLGHANASLVLSTYGHLLPDSDDRTRSAIDDAWNAARVTAVSRDVAAER